ncbi:hypothetical protein ACFSGX_14435 [Sphingomonas arantia]|uniref:Uncharacterized protein n=1 Tax=Sphingomonas arantia TaxID=1460676 RepID=A0ABW4U286_9SPHN
MTDPLTLTRFRELADAYGGAVARWPERYRAAGVSLAATPAGAAIIAGADELDARLDLWRVPAPAGDLAARIVAGAPVVTPRAASRLRWWWSGVGIAATLAGAAAGTAAVAIVVPTESVGGGNGSTSFGDITGSDG